MMINYAHHEKFFSPFSRHFSSKCSPQHLIIRRTETRLHGHTEQQVFQSLRFIVADRWTEESEWNDSKLSSKLICS
jgi:hypothetical protein